VRALASVAFAYPGTTKLKRLSYQGRTIPASYSPHTRPHLQAEQQSEEIGQSYQKHLVLVAQKRAVYRTRRARYCLAVE
jgi:hypothetical protein